MVNSYHEQPSVTPAGFSSDRDGNGEIYVMDAAGTNQTRLTNDAANEDTSGDATAEVERRVTPRSGFRRASLPRWT
jgi:Tol biopolymer transport system component